MEWIYGRNVVQLALAAGARRRAHRLAATPPALKPSPVSSPTELPVDTVSGAALDELTGSRDHQGVALQVDAVPYATADDVLAAEIVVVLDEVSDPRNLGAVARSALAAGAARPRRAEAPLGLGDAGRRQGVGRHHRASCRSPR